MPFRAAKVMSLAHFGSFALRFFVPLVLSRALPVAEFGDLRRVLYLHSLALLIAPLGIDQAMPFFQKARRLGSTEARFLGFLTKALLVVPVALVFAAAIPGLPFWFFVWTSIQVAGSHLGFMDLASGAPRRALVFEILGAAATALCLLAGPLGVHSLSSTCAALAACSLLITGARLRPWTRTPAVFRKCGDLLRYSWPLGATNLLIYLAGFDALVVSEHSGLKAFTLYSLGCLTIPVLPSVMNTLFQAMAVEMTDESARADDRLTTWYSTVRAGLLTAVPPVVFLSLFADPVIRLLYTSRYAAAAAYLPLFMGITLLHVIDTEQVFKVHEQRSLLLRVQITATVVTCAVFGVVLWLFGPWHALLARLVADLVTTIWKLALSRRILQASWRNFWPWGTGAGVFAVSLAAGVAVREGFHSSAVAQPSLAALAALVYGVILLAAYFLHASVSKCRARSKETIPPIWQAPAISRPPLPSAESYTVAICTYERPALLADLLADLVRQALRPGVDEILVVDNGSSLPCRKAVDEARDWSPCEIRYVAVNGPDLSGCRNAALREARGTTLIFLDDDQSVGPAFFSDLRLEWEMTGVQVVAASFEVYPRLETKAPSWLPLELFGRSAGKENGGRLSAYDMGTGGVALRLAGVREAGVRFDPRFGRSGGEDTRFFWELAAHGLGLIGLPSVRVAERVNASRIELASICRTAIRKGALTRAVKAAAIPRHELIGQVVRCGLKSMTFALLAILIWPFGRWRMMAAFRSLEYGAFSLLGPDRGLSLTREGVPHAAGAS